MTRIANDRELRQREPRERDAKFLAWLHDLPCVACACALAGGRALPSRPGPIQAAHLRYSIPTRPNPGMQRRPSDRYATPLCMTHHAEQHAGSERDFWRNLGVDPFALCDSLHAAFAAGAPGAAVIKRFAS